VLLHIAAIRPSPDALLDGPNRERHARHRLESLTRVAAPESYAAAESEGREDPAWQAACESIGERLKAALATLQLLADLGYQHSAALAGKGRERESARKDLFRSLAGQYQRLFGRLPGPASTTSSEAEKEAGESRDTRPGGPVFDWFRALLDVVGGRAHDALAEGDHTAADRGQRDELLRELIHLSVAMRKGKRGDGLAGRIRDGSAACRLQPPSCPEISDPTFKPPPLGDLFKP